MDREAVENLIKSMVKELNEGKSDTIGMINEHIKKGTYEKFCSDMGCKTNTLDKKIRAATNYKKDRNLGFIVKTDNLKLDGFENNIDTDSDNTNNYINNTNKDTNNTNKDNIINNNISNINNNVNNKNKDNIINSMNNLDNNPKTEQEKSDTLTSAQFLANRKQLFGLIMDNLEGVEITKTKVTSLALYADAAKTLDYLASTYRLSKQELVSASIMALAAALENK